MSEGKEEHERAVAYAKALGRLQAHVGTVADLLAGGEVSRAVAAERLREALVWSDEEVPLPRGRSSREEPATPSSANEGGGNAREQSEMLASESTAIEVACPVCASLPGEACVEPGSRLLAESPREAFHVGRCAAFFAGGQSDA